MIKHMYLSSDNKKHLERINTFFNSGIKFPFNSHLLPLSSNIKFDDSFSDVDFKFLSGLIDNPFFSSYYFKFYSTNDGDAFNIVPRDFDFSDGICLYMKESYDKSPKGEDLWYVTSSSVNDIFHDFSFVSKKCVGFPIKNDFRNLSSLLLKIACYNDKKYGFVSDVCDDIYSETGAHNIYAINPSLTEDIGRLYLVSNSSDPFVRSAKNFASEPYVAIKGPSKILSN